MLEWLGRHGSRAIAASFVVAIALAPLGELLEAWLTESVFALLALSFLRIDVTAAMGHLARPAWPLLAVLWTVLVVPVAAGLLMQTTGLASAHPGVFQGLMLHAMASPLLAAPALAAIMGLDATLVLITMVAGSLVLPFTATLHATLFLQGQIELAPGILGLRLLALLAGAALVGLGLRWLLGPRRIDRHRHTIDGLNVLVLFIFAVVVMKEVVPQSIAHPGLVVLLTLVSFVVCLVLFLGSFLAFRAAGRERAEAIGFMTSQRNMGIIVAGVGGAIHDVAWLYFALSQFPVYLAPYLLRPFVRSSGAAPGR